MVVNRFQTEAKCQVLLITLQRLSWKQRSQLWRRGAEALA